MVCKNCGSEVSPYITECPYCGERLRKRAPKIERDEQGAARAKVRKPAKPSLGRLMPNEIPGIRGDELQRPYVTIALVLLGAIGFLTLIFVSSSDIALVRAPEGELWRIAVSPFVYVSATYQFVCLFVIGLFGFLLERRHGSLLVAFLFVLCGIGGMVVVAALDPTPLALGGNGAALGLLAAWAVPHLLARRGRDPDDDEADMMGVLVLAVLVAAMPIAVYEADPVAGTVGGLLGLLVGLVLARLRPRTAD